MRLSMYETYYGDDCAPISAASSTKSNSTKNVSDYTKLNSKMPNPFSYHKTPENQIIGCLCVVPA